MDRSLNREPFIPWFAEEYSGPTHRNTLVHDYLSLKPQDIKAELEKNVINQDEACRRVAIMMYHHLQGRRFVSLLAGPTGSGKSFIAENLKRVFPDVVYIRDISNVTNDGWSGSKKVGNLFEGVHGPYSYNGVIHPLIFLDECDKLFSPRTNGHGENVSESVQSEFLCAIHGGEIRIKNRDDVENSTVIDTSNMSFLFAGAFERRAKNIVEEESGKSIGFGANLEKAETYSRDLTIEDVKEAGCITELCGRIQTIVSLNKLTEKDFRTMLETRDRGPVYEMEREFNLTIHISNKKKDEMAHKAYVNGYGIRGMKNEIREHIDELTWIDCCARDLEID